MPLRLSPLRRSYVSDDADIDKEGSTVVLRVHISVPWDSRIDERMGSFLVEENGKVDGYL